MTTSVSQAVPTTHPIKLNPGLERLSGISHEQLTEGMIWLAGHRPEIFDELLNAVDPAPGEEPDGSDDPAPVCEICGAALGIFLKLGLDWRHYRGTSFDDLEIYDAGHPAFVSWCESPAKV